MGAETAITSAAAARAIRDAEELIRNRLRRYAHGRQDAPEGRGEVVPLTKPEQEQPQ
jgi:hypothetical protein